MAHHTPAEMMDLEQRLLALLLASAPEDSPFFAEFAVGAPQLDWQHFADLVDRHRVGALVHHAVKHLPAIQLPEELAETLAGTQQRNMQRFMRTVSVTAQLTEQFAAAGISAAALKGAAIAQQYYREPSSREMIDVDLLVEPGRYDDAEQIVLAAGFERTYPSFEMSPSQRASFKALHNAFSYLRRSDRLQVDLHWRTSQNPALMPHIDAQWPSMVQTVDVAGAKLPVLGPAAHFVYVMVHGAKHGWSRLKWLVDVDRIVRQLSPEQISEAERLCREYQLERLAGGTLRLARDILGTPSPNGFAILSARDDARNLAILEMPMIFGELPGQQHSVKHWRQYLVRMRHSLSLHSGAGYRRSALLRELARPLDIETVAVRPGSIWTLALISPVLGAGRALKRLAAREQI